MLDIVIVGSGPSSISSLISLSNSKKKICIVTGENKLSDKKKFSINHPKISFLTNTNKYFSDFFFNLENKNKIYSSNRIGGLGNYWGQGFGKNNYQNLNQKKLFKNEQDYKKIICKLYNYFNINIDNKFELNKNIFLKSKILKGYKNFKNLNLNTFSHLFKNLTKNRTVIHSKVLKIEDKTKYLKVFLNSGQVIYSKKVLLAAGVIGNLKIIFNSFKYVNTCKFNDDCPFLYYSFIFNNKFVKNISNFISYTHSNKNSFASIYSLSKIDLKFLIYYIAKIKIILKKKFYLKFLKNFIFFQVWNNQSLEEVICNRDNTYFVKKKSKSKNKLNLKIKKMFVFYSTKTLPGQGFHYHNLRIKEKWRFFHLENFLKTKFKSKVICIDSSIAKKIEPGPYTASEMAISYKIAKKFR